MKKMTKNTKCPTTYAKTMTFGAQRSDVGMIWVEIAPEFNASGKATKKIVCSVSSSITSDNLEWHTAYTVRDALNLAGITKAHMAGVLMARNMRLDEKGWPRIAA